MAIPNVMLTGRSGMQASKAGITTSGHNIANASTEGFSRQRVETSSQVPVSNAGSKKTIGVGVLLDRVSRINDDYIDKQIRNAGRDLASFEEKELLLRQTEDIFNEMNGDGLNRLMSHFFNEFRKLSNEPDSEALRQSVRETSLSVVNDLKRMRVGVEDVRKHVDARIESALSEVNSLGEQIRDLNLRIKVMENGGGNANDLQDTHARTLKKLAEMVDIQVYEDNSAGMTVNLKGVGPLVSGPNVEKLSTFRSPGDEDGKIENALDIKSSSSSRSVITHLIQGGKLGALIDVRDHSLSMIVDRLDELAYALTTSVNQLHEQGYTARGEQGVQFFKQMNDKFRAAEFIDLSDEVKQNVNSIATAAAPDAPGDNRIALAISAIQQARIMNEGKASMDEYYNSIVTDVAVVASRNKNALNQQKDIKDQLNKMREQIAGVSIDEETTNLLQYQHAFDASAKVIQVADEMLKTVLDLKR